MPSQLSEYFSGIGAKKLRQVEIEPNISNQHEFNGITEFRNILGNERNSFHSKFIYIADNEEDIIEDVGTLTWYDARESHPTRTEYRLYYPSNAVMDKALSGDLVLIGRTSHDTLAVIIAPQGSTSEQQLLWLFGLEEVGNRFIIRDLTIRDIELNFAGRYIITSLGFEVPDTAPDYLEEIIERFGLVFPKTAAFSDYARSTIPDVYPIDEPDKTLMLWLESEVMLFKTLEKHLVAEKLQQGFGESGIDVDEFISFSLSVQNRRKSRAGYAFENHLAAIFNAHRLSFSRGAKTERNNKPDFLFPGISYYKNPVFSTELLTMLGLKTSAKERWRQVLPEADRISQKHLITLEPAISKNQTDEMIAQNLQLVLPQPIMDTYTSVQQSLIINLSDFITHALNKQRRIR